MAASSSGSATRSGTGLGGGTGRFTACPNASPAASASAAASGVAARRGANGTVTNLSSNSLTVHDARCNTDVKVSFDQSVIIRKLGLGQASDLQENQTVTVTGTRQSDGSIKANTITLGAAGGFGGGGAAANGG